METCNVERRLRTPPDSPASATGIVRQALVLQHDTGTISAIEFLKAHEVKGTVIQRVLSGHAVRAEDRLVLQGL